MSDGNEEREELRRRREQEREVDREDRVERDESYDGEPERGGS
jgi:hypothetical protein